MNEIVKVIQPVIVRQWLIQTLDWYPELDKQKKNCNNDVIFFKKPLIRPIIIVPVIPKR